MKAGQRLENRILMLCCGRPIRAIKRSSCFFGSYANSVIKIKGLSPFFAKSSLKRSLPPSMPAKHPRGCPDELFSYTRNVLIKSLVQGFAERLTRQRHRGVLIQPSVKRHR
jgi:hypothetical protein